MDLDSVPVGSKRTDLYQERYIHGGMYKARPDVNAVVHSHTGELIVFGASAGTVPLRPIMNGGTFIGDGLPVFDIRKFRVANETIISTPALGTQLSQVIGKSGAALLLGHGAVTVASSLYALVGRAEALRENARVEEQAIALGGNVTYLTQYHLPLRQCRAHHRALQARVAAGAGSIGCGQFLSSNHLYSFTSIRERKNTHCCRSTGCVRRPTYTGPIV